MADQLWFMQAYEKKKKKTRWVVQSIEA